MAKFTAPPNVAYEMAIKRSAQNAIWQMKMEYGF